MNRKNLTAAVLAGLAGVVGLAGAAQAGVSAVNLNPDGLGEVLLYPYYTTNDDNTTLVTVVNTTGEAKAVKVRFMEGFNSREVLDFNLYLSEYDVWVAAIADGAAFGGDAGTATLFVPDTSCTVPYIYGDSYDEDLEGGVQEFLPYAYTGDYEDGGPTDLSRTTEGYFEIIEMGTMTDGDARAAKTLNSSDPGRIGSATAATHVIKEDDDGNEYVEPEDCGLLVRNWTLYGDSSIKDDPQDGWWMENALANCDPDDGFVGDEFGCGQADNNHPGWVGYDSTGMNSGGLFGGAAIINVPKGTMFSYDAKAIQGFDTTDSGTHYYPGTIHPSLNDGSTMSAVVFLGGGAQATLSYNRGVDAISAVFMHDELNNTFVIDEEIAAGTEWVMTLPTKSWYVDPEITGVTIEWTPDPDDLGCNGWDPGEPFPPRCGPDVDDVCDPPADQTGWEQCTYIKDADQNEAYAPFTELFYGDACEVVSFKSWDREESPFEQSYGYIPPIVSPAPPLPERPGETPFELCYEVNVLRFGEVSVFGTESDLLYSVEGTPSEGWARITFGNMDDCVACNKADDELHVDSAGMVGLPITGFSAEQYTNGMLEGGVLANYGGLFQHKGSVGCPSGGPSSCSSSAQ